ncbi:MAG: Integral rane protein, partial [Thermoleophilia bacterium]|nr:Integral rane protein [Thermoleophilia bacterium]
MTVNLLVGNPDRAAVARDILAADPDVIVLQEYDPKWHRTLHAKLGTRYPYEVHETRDDSFGSAIYSRTPFVGPAPEPFTLAQNETPQYRAVVHLAGRDVAIYDVHLMPPVSRDYVITGRHEFADLRRRVRRERLPMILAGDLNVSASSPQHHDLGDAGLIDAWELVRHGRGATWPATRGINWLPGVRLDHLYLSGELTTTRVRVGDANGSDHRPVVADVVAARARSMQRVAVAAVDERRAVRAEARVELAGCGAGATCAAEGEQAEGQGADDRGKWLHGRSPSR